jgi:hypothetical protein
MAICLRGSHNRRGGQDEPAKGSRLERALGDAIEPDRSRQSRDGEGSVSTDVAAIVTRSRLESAAPSAQKPTPVAS